MTEINLGRLISRYVNYQTSSMPKPQASQTPMPSTQASKSSAPAAGQSSSPQMAEMQGVDQSVYVKDMMKLPKNMNEFLYMLQRNITLAQLNQRFAQANRASLSQTQAQILAQLQGLSLSEANEVLLNGNKALAGQMQSALKNLALSPTGMINLSDVALMIQTNGKDAITKLITTMANSAKLGITDLSQLKETAKLINASVATAAKNDGAQTMKLLMLLYLPWLPLQEGVGFDLEMIKTAF